MRLRKQLFFASLFTLSLPWVGCKYVQEMEETLLEGQTEALRSTALAIAATIEADSTLADSLARFSSPESRKALYLQPFFSPLILDGYSEDWLSYGYRPHHFEHLNDSNPNMEVYSGLRGEQIWLHFRVPATSINYFNPSKPSSAADRIVLTLRDGSGHTELRDIVASSQGKTQNFIVANKATSRSIDHSINGVWRESEEGFTVELQLPFALAVNGLGFTVFSANASQPSYTNIRSSATEDIIPRSNYQSEPLRESLSIFQRPGIRLSVSSAHQAKVASDGRLGSIPYEQETPWLLEMMFGLALTTKEYPQLPSPDRDGFFNHSELLTSLSGQEQHSRYNLSGHTILSVGVPIKQGQRVIGAVLAEQNARSLSSFTNQAFSRLLLYSIAVSFGSALILVLYASWLSVRIGSLSKSASGAISESGKVSEHFRSSSINDEVGDLSRSFAQLLSRLKEYTHYLKTLSSKLSHELRTPLAIVSSSLDNLEHEKLSPQAKIYAQRAKEGTTRLSSILNAMSAASRVEQAIGNAELDHIPLDELLSNLRAAYADIYQHVTVKLNIQYHKDGFDIHASGELLVQMLDKLVDNAADFCPKQGMIEIGLYREQSDLVITVRNEGPPLPHTMHNQLFDSMVSVRETKAQEPSNGHHLGLGLYIVRLIVDFHQGHVQGYNLPDSSGVIFEIRLPSNSHSPRYLSSK